MDDMTKNALDVTDRSHIKDVRDKLVESERQLESWFDALVTPIPFEHVKDEAGNYIVIDDVPFQCLPENDHAFPLFDGSLAGFYLAHGALFKYDSTMNLPAVEELTGGVYTPPPPRHSSQDLDRLASAAVNIVTKKKEVPRMSLDEMRRKVAEANAEITRRPCDIAKKFAQQEYAHAVVLADPDDTSVVYDTPYVDPGSDPELRAFVFYDKDFYITALIEQTGPYMRLSLTYKRWYHLFGAAKVTQDWTADHCFTLGFRDLSYQLRRIGNRIELTRQTNLKAFTIA